MSQRDSTLGNGVVRDALVCVWGQEWEERLELG